MAHQKSIFASGPCFHLVSLCHAKKFVEGVKSGEVVAFDTVKKATLPKEDVTETQERPERQFVRQFLETPLPDESNQLHNSGWQSKASVKASCGATRCHPARGRRAVPLQGRPATRPLLAAGPRSRAHSARRHRAVFPAHRARFPRLTSVSSTTSATCSPRCPKRGCVAPSGIIWPRGRRTSVPLTTSELERP